jgi:hypothetical protein
LKKCSSQAIFGVIDGKQTERRDWDGMEWNEIKWNGMEGKGTEGNEQNRTEQNRKDQNRTIFIYPPTGLQQHILS